jgi:hypothetical protein
MTPTRATTTITKDAIGDQTKAMIARTVTTTMRGASAISHMYPDSFSSGTGEAPIFLPPDAAVLLDGKLLDAELAGDLARFAVKAQR